MSEDLGGVPPIPAPPEEFFEQLRASAVELEPDDLARCTRYLELLYSANERMNLTGVRDPAAAWMRHIFDSLTLLPFLLECNAQRVADIGSGGGVPGLVLAAVLPDVDFTLVESVGKKARFLDETARAMGLTRVRVRQERAEVLGAGDLRECMDVVLGRAVARLPALLEYMLPMVKPEGIAIAVKGEQAATEVAESVRALGELRGRVVEQKRTPTGTLIIIEKTGRTPKRYPRAAGEPEKFPL